MGAESQWPGWSRHGASSLQMVTWEGCSPHEQLAGMIVPKSHPKSFGSHSQQLFSSTEIRSGSWGPPQTRTVLAHRQLCEFLLSEGVDLGNPDIPSGNPLFPSRLSLVQKVEMPPGSVSDLMLLWFVVYRPAVRPSLDPSHPQILHSQLCALHP